MRLLGVEPYATATFQVASRSPPGNADERAWRSKSRGLLALDGVVGGSNLTADKYEQLALGSDFCLVVPGDTASSSRLYKFIFAGCVPVILISSPRLLPFADLLRWRSFSVIVDVSVLYNQSLMQQLHRHLQAFRTLSADEGALSSELPGHGGSSDIRGHIASSSGVGDALTLPVLRMRLREAQRLLDWSAVDFPSVYHLTLIELARNTLASPLVPRFAVQSGPARSQNGAGV